MVSTSAAPSWLDGRRVKCTVGSRTCRTNPSRRYGKACAFAGISARTPDALPRGERSAAGEGQALLHRWTARYENSVLVIFVVR